MRMKRRAMGLLIATSMIFPGAARAEFNLLSSRLDLATNSGSVKSKALPDGNFLISTAPATTGLGRLYWMRPGGAVFRTAVAKGSTSSGSDYRHVGVAIDKVGNAYAFGYESNGMFMNDDLVVYRFDSSGAQLWRRTADPTLTARSEVVYDGEVDEYGNLVLFGGVYNGAFTSLTPYAARFRPNGTISMVSNFGAGATNAHDGVDMALAPDGGMHFATDNEVSGWYWRLNASGTVIVDEAEQIGFHPRAIAANNSRAVMAGMSTSEDGEIAEWRSLNPATGALQFNSSYIPTGTPPYAGHSEYTKVALDNSGNILAIGHVLDPSHPFYQNRFEKYSPSGTQLWSFIGAAVGRDYLAGDIGIDAWNRFWLTWQMRSPTESSLVIEQFTPAGPRIDYRTYTAPTDLYTPTSLALQPKNGDALFGFIRNTSSRAQAVVYRSSPVGVAETYAPTNIAIWNSTVSVLNNDRYLAGASLRLHTGATKGVVSLNTTTGHFSYDRNPGASGADTFRYRLEKAGFPNVIVTVTLNLVP